MSTELYQQVDPEEVGMSSAYLGNVDALVERHLAENAYQGSVVLVARHGKVCYFKAFGKADEGVPMATDSIFRLMSMSKVVAAACVMQLFEQGRIALHEPISTYLPEFADPKVAVVKDWGVTQLVTAEREITPHDLLSMTAGMTNTWWHRVFEPSVYGVVSGLDFDTYQRRNILEPLQMHETWFFTPEDQHHRIAAVYEAGRDEKVTEARPLGLGMLGPGAAFSPHHTYFSGAGGLNGTTADYFRFAQMLLNKGELEGVRVLSPMSVRLMTTNQIGDLNNWQLTQNKWGYMVDVQEGENAPSGSIHYLGGPGAYSWQGFFSTKFVNNPRLDTVIMTMSTPAFDGALPHNLRMVTAATAAVVD